MGAPEPIAAIATGDPDRCAALHLHKSILQPETYQAGQYPSPASNLTLQPKENRR